MEIKTYYDQKGNLTTSWNIGTLFPDAGALFHDPRKLFNDPGAMLHDPVSLFQEPGTLFQDSVNEGESGIVHDPVQIMLYVGSSAIVGNNKPGPVKGPCAVQRLMHFLTALSV